MLNSYQQIIEILEEMKELLNKSEKLSGKVQMLLKRQKNVMETNDKNTNNILIATCIDSIELPVLFFTTYFKKRA